MPLFIQIDTYQILKQLSSKSPLFKGEETLTPSNYRNYRKGVSYKCESA